MTFTNPTPPPATFPFRALRLIDNGVGSLQITQQDQIDLEARNGGTTAISGAPTFSAPAPAVPAAP
jgi:hypothetical protein